MFLTCKFCGAQGKYGDVPFNGWRFAKNAPFCYVCPNPKCIAQDDAKKAKK